MVTVNPPLRNIFQNSMIYVQLHYGLIFIIMIIIIGLYKERNYLFSHLIYYNLDYYFIHAKIYQSRRVSAVGCECGLVKVAIVNVVNLQVSQSWLLRYDKPVSSIVIFPHQNNISKPSFVNSEYLSIRFSITDVHIFDLYGICVTTKL